MTESRQLAIADALHPQDAERIHEEAKEAAAEIMARFQMAHDIAAAYRVTLEEAVAKLKSQVEAPAPEGTGADA